VVSTEIRLALAPAATYRRLVESRADTTWRAALAPLLLSLVLIGSFAAILATRRVTFGLVVTTTASWSFALLLQAGAASVLIASSRRRSVSVRRGLELFFLGHAPWSLWMLAVMARVIVWNPETSLELLLASAVLPIGWTAVILSAFCQMVLGTTADGARLRTAVHQACIIGIILSYVAWAAGGWMRIVEVVTP
jgi:hypothetical protein